MLNFFLHRPESRKVRHDQSLELSLARELRAACISRYMAKRKRHPALYKIWLEAMHAYTG